MWQIVCHPNTPATDLAMALCVSASRVRNARYRFRREGWSCRVAYVPCVACGAPATVGGHVRRDRAYHPACKPAARMHRQRTLDRRRWERSDVHERTRLLDKRTDYDEHYQAMTRQTATRHGARWSAEHDTFLIEHADEADYRLAQALGRSLRAVRSRQGTLRQRGMS